MQAKAKRRWLWPLAAVVVILIGVVVFQPAFGGEQANTTVQDAVAALPAAEMAQAEVAPAEIQPAAPPVEQETSQDAPDADTPSSDNCIACHTNQALLQQLAEEPEVVESELASGEG